MVGWRHRLNGHESEQTQGVGDGQGGLVLCIPWGHKESATAERPNKRNNPNTKSKIKVWGVWGENPLPLIDCRINEFSVRLPRPTSPAADKRAGAMMCGFKNILFSGIAVMSGIAFLFFAHLHAGWGEAEATRRGNTEAPQTTPAGQKDGALGGRGGGGM